jgi:hypothetical protein
MNTTNRIYSEQNFNPHKHVKEFKRTCKECRKVWHSLCSREKAIDNEIRTKGSIQASQACSGNMGAAAQMQRNAESQKDLLNKLKKCPNCGSGNYKEEIIIYEKK